VIGLLDIIWLLEPAVGREFGYDMKFLYTRISTVKFTFTRSSYRWPFLPHQNLGDRRRPPSLFSSNKRYDDMVPNQETFVDQFLSPFFERMLNTTPIQKIFLIPGKLGLGLSVSLRGNEREDHRPQSEKLSTSKWDTNSSDTLLFLRPVSAKRL